LLIILNLNGLLVVDLGQIMHGLGCDCCVFFSKCDSKICKDSICTDVLVHIIGMLSDKIYSYIAFIVLECYCCSICVVFCKQIGQSSFNNGLFMLQV